MSRLRGLCCLVALGCHGTPSARDRALARLPAGARFVAVADGPALGAANVRKGIDAARVFVPTSMGCVVDAALAADAVAVAEDVHGIAIVVVSSAPAKCAALSTIAPGIAVATIGAVKLADATRPLDDPRWDRARDYLEHSAIAAAIDLGDHHVVAAIQTDPLELWVTIDSAIAAPDLGAFFAQWKAQPLETKLSVTRVDRQLAIRATRLSDVDLATLVTATIVAVEAPSSTLAKP